MIKQYRVRTYSHDTQVAVHDSFNGQMSISITRFRDSHIIAHEEVMIDREHLKEIIADMDKDAQND